MAIAWTLIQFFLGPIGRYIGLGLIVIAAYAAWDLSIRHDERNKIETNQKIEREHAVETGKAARTDAAKRFDAGGMQDDGFRRD